LSFARADAPPAESVSDETAAATTDQKVQLAQNDSATPPEGTPAPAASEPTNIPPSTTPPSDKITFSGVMDFYYQYQFSNPKQNNRLNGRIYDFRHNTPTLTLVWADIVKPTPKEGGLGWTLSLATGDSVDADHADAGSGKGEARWKNFQQIYGTYATKSGVTVDLGKYLSPYGYDTTKVILNYNYSLTLATFLAPNYAGGLRVTYPLKTVGKGSFLQGYIINSIYHTNTSGINEDNGRPDFILRASYTTPDEKFSYIPAFGFGKDRLVSPATGFKNNEKVFLWDNWLTYKATPETTLAGEYIYRKGDGSAGSYDIKGQGYGLYFRQQLTPKNAVAVRWSGLHNKTSVPATGTTSFTANEITGTYEIKLTPALTTRLEYRHDHSNNPSAFGFTDDDKATLKGSQDTATVAFLYTF
jgi:hypothetical protein